MNDKPLNGKTILITGSAKRVGRLFALACARAGADIVIHHGHSREEALQVKGEIEALGRKAYVIASDLGKPAEAARLIAKANKFSPLFALVNSAAIFEPLSFDDTTLDDWERHMALNLRAPFLLSQEFARHFPAQGGVLAAEDGSESKLGVQGRIVNIVDWRALRPGADHFAYTISKAALASLTQSMAAALAPRITVNGLALGAILPPSDGKKSDKIIKDVPAKRWSEPQEAGEALVFLLTGPSYITGEIIHVDGGRHLV